MTWYENFISKNQVSNDSRSNLELPSNVPLGHPSGLPAPIPSSLSERIPQQSRNNPLLLGPVATTVLPYLQHFPNCNDRHLKRNYNNFPLSQPHIYYQLSFPNTPLSHAPTYRQLPSYQFNINNNAGSHIDWQHNFQSNPVGGQNWLLKTCLKNCILSQLHQPRNTPPVTHVIPESTGETQLLLAVAEENTPEKASAKRDQMDDTRSDRGTAKRGKRNNGTKARNDESTSSPIVHSSPKIMKTMRKLKKEDNVLAIYIKPKKNTNLSESETKKQENKLAKARFRAQSRKHQFEELKQMDPCSLSNEQTQFFEHYEFYAQKKRMQSKKRYYETKQAMSDILQKCELDRTNAEKKFFDACIQRKQSKNLKDRCRQRVRRENIRDTQVCNNNKVQYTAILQGEAK